MDIPMTHHIFRVIQQKPNSALCGSSVPRIKTTLGPEIENN